MSNGLVTLPTLEKPQGEQPTSVEVVSEGILSCWHGKYHYVEPWIGCEHDCIYCYARHRTPVLNDLKQMKTGFQKPRSKFSEVALLNTIAEELVAKNVVTAKLCRYTDILSPRYVQSGLAKKVIQVICESSVKRIIVTTKGVPDQAIIDLCIEHKPKISYNIGVRPIHELTSILEPDLSSLEARLEAAAQLAKAGVEVTVHMDPILVGFDDQEEYLDPFLDLLAKQGLRKFVFSYLLFSNEIIRDFEKKIGKEKTQKLLKHYQRDSVTQIVRKDQETQYYQLIREDHKASILKISEKLKTKGFDFVLCSLKAKNGVVQDVKGETNICYGSFYA